MEKLWTTAEVAQFLGIQEVDVEQLVREGELTAYKLGGQFLRFRPDRVEALKGKVRFRPNSKKASGSKRETWYQRCREFIYFYDFYVVSVSLVAVLVIYLMVSG